MDKNHYCVIMAGGIGRRFWPLSKASRPKQFLEIPGSGRTLLQTTYDRFSRIVLPENIFVVTNISYLELVKEQLPGIAESHILSEPLRRNTAPCIALANHYIKRENPSAIVVVTPSDHIIDKEELFQSEINKAFEFAATGNVLLTLGIKPDRPEAAYGYIQMNQRAEVTCKYDNLKRVKTFTEKPDAELAKVFHESGEFLWNSGIFIWSLSSIMNAYSKYLPDMDALFGSVVHQLGTAEELESLGSIYSQMKNISIDHGIMEKAEDVFVFVTSFDWTDLGSWKSLYDLSLKDKHENLVVGNDVFTYEVKDTIVNVPNGKIVVLQGLKGYIVAESGNTLLICRREEEHRIRQFLNDVKIERGEDRV